MDGSRRLLVMLVVSIWVAGCAGRGASPAQHQAGQEPVAAETGEAAAAYPPAEPANPALTAIGVIATPFYVVLKSIVCATTMALAAPAAAIVSLTEEPYRERTRQELGDGVGRNCGSPWVLY